MNDRKSDRNRRKFQIVVQDVNEFYRNAMETWAGLVLLGWHKPLRWNI